MGKIILMNSWSVSVRYEPANADCTRKYFGLGQGAGTSQKQKIQQMSSIMREDWIEVELGEIYSSVGGGTPSKNNSEYWNGNIPWASIKDVKGNFLEKTQDFITEIGLKENASYLALENEIILATIINPGKPIISKIKTAN